MKLVIVSGRSGSGKSTALNVLEDLGYYCIDNLPVGLLLELVSQSSLNEDQRLGLVAVSIDARNLSSGIEKFPDFHRQCVAQNIDVDVLFLDAHNDTLLKRFHSTRRKHPLSNTTRSLKEAIAHERELLDPIAANADLTINTSDLTLYELRDLVKLRVAGRKTQEIALLFQSFGFKHGVPSDADFVFDVRCLPNPYWDPTLRGYTGLEDPVIQFLSEQPESEEMAQDIISFLNKWIPRFQNSNRSYMTIAIGCTGGQHRSVYLCEKIGRYFSTSNDNVQIRHKELPSTTE
jgi:UPF0042 nucleotide-binding protein